MASLLCMVKPVSDWSEVELHAYNIVVELQDATTFFMEGKSGLLFVWLVLCNGISDRCIR